MRKNLIAIALTSCLFSGFAAGSNDIVQSPWLYKVVPDNITAYARIPHPLFYFAATQSPQDSLYKNADYRDAIGKITDKIVQYVGDSSIKPQDKQLISLLLSQLKAPVELTLTAIPADLSSPPALLIASKLGFSEQEDFAREFLSLFKKLPISIDSQAEGKGSFVINPHGIPGSYQYDAASGKLLLLIGGDTELLSSLIAAPEAGESKLPQITKQIDATGQGLLLWARPPAGLLASVPQMLPPVASAAKQWFSRLRLDSLQELALGFGDAGGRPKLKLIIAMPNVGLRQLFPTHTLATNIAYQGQPAYVTSLSLPNEEQLDNIVALLDAEAEFTPRYQKLKTSLQQHIGIDFASLLAVTGGKIVLFADANDSYFALPATAEAALIKILSQLQSKGIPIEYDSQELNSQTIHHISLQKVYEKLGEKQAKRKGFPVSLLAALAGSLYFHGNHIYWVKEGDYLIFNSLPQPLMARVGKMSGTLAQWQTSQGQDSSDATFAGTLNYQYLAQKSYYANLRFLNVLADATAISVDMTKFPTAKSLSLPEWGSVRLAVNNGGDALRIELSTENGVSDIYTMVTSAYGMAPMATLGILSAIAIPAYQDYTLRAQTAGTLQLLYPVKNAVAEKIAAGTDPTSITTETLSSDRDDIAAISEFSSHIKDISVDNGEIIVTFSGRNYGETLVLSPQIEGDKVSGWSCNKGTLAAKLRPSTCRNK